MHLGHGFQGAQASVVNTLLLKRDLFQFLDTVGLEQKAITYVPLIGGGFWLVNHPDAVRQVLTADEQSIGKPEFLKQSNRGHHGDGLASLSGNQWETRRRLVAGAFTSALQARIASESRAATIAALAQLPHNAPIDLSELFSKLVIRIGARWILSADVSDAGQEDALPWSEAKGIRYRVDVPGIASDLMPSQRLRADVVPVLRKIILAKWRKQADPDHFIGALHAKCVAQSVMLTEAEVCDEIIQLLFASHHTVTTTLIQCIDFLHRNPVHLARLMDGAGLNARLTRDDATDRKYTECFIKEVMRFCMPTPLLFREAMKAHIIAQHTVSAGDLLVISPYLLHRNETHFPRPLEFDPQRFFIPIDHYSYLPFGAGPRRCVAHRLALKQMQIIVETTLKSGRFRPLQEAPANPFSVNYPGCEYRALFERLSG